MVANDIEGDQDFGAALDRVAHPVPRPFLFHLAQSCTQGQESVMITILASDCGNKNLACSVPMTELSVRQTLPNVELY